MTCDSCTGGCPCSPDERFLPNDRRFAEQLPLKGACEVYACHMGPEANTYVVTVRGPDGRQRTGLGCVKHLYLIAAQCLSGVRLEPFDADG